MRALVFDLDGTLVDSREDIVACLLGALSDLGLRSALEPAEVGALVGRPLTEMLAAAAPSLDAAGLEAAAGRYRARFVTHGQDHSRLYPGVRELFAALPARLLLGCATTKRPEPTLQVLEAFGIKGRLHAWRGTSEEMAYKPAPDVLHAIAADLGVPPAEMWYVGDTAADLLAARAAGAAGLWASWGYGAPDACREAAPLHTLGAPGELLGLIEP